MRRPWLQADAPFVAWVPSRDSAATAVMDGAQHLMRVHGEGARWSPIQLVSDPLDVSGALASWAGVQVKTDRELAEAVGASVAHVPRIFVVKLGAAREVSIWRERCSRLSELTQKLKDTSLCFLFAVAADDDADLDMTRLDIAWPASLRRLPTEDDRWGSYIHERIAWHVGGRVDDAVDVLDSVAKLARGDDIGLEAVLWQHAEARCATIPTAITTKLGSSLVSLRAHPRLCMPTIVPGTGGVHRPLPWLARGLLGAHSAHPQRRFLRAAVTCRPMAMKLLGRCIDLEARIKDVVLDKLIRNVALPEQTRFETENAFQRVIGAAPGVERDLMPPGHPLPDHAWELASLGTVEHSAACPAITRQIRWVRNALAHGAPVGWRAFALVDGLERELDAQTSVGT